MNVRKSWLTLIFSLLIAHCPVLFAMDFGLILDQTIGYDGYGNDGEFEYTGVAIPRFSAMLSDTSEIYISAGVKYQTNPQLIVPELLRTELSWYFDKGDLKLGRMYYSDPLGVIADGLFDGMQYSFDTAAGSFSAGAWYTGLLYKERANIAMTTEEAISNAVKFEFDDFADTYFAPRRFLSALGWEHQSVGELFKANAALIGQFDLSGEDLHSQYLAARVSMPVQAFVFNLGGCVELIETADDFYAAFAGEMGFTWMPSTTQQLLFSGRYAGGVSDSGDIVAFLPLTTVSQGEILEARFSGLSIISLAYTVKFRHNVAASLSSLYFVRNDLGSYNAYPVEGDSGGYFMGNEFFGRVFWSPVSDLSFNLGAGAFLPSMGNVAPEADMLWRLELNVVLSLY